MARFPNWGTSAEEMSRVMDGDHLIDHPSYVSTMAVTIYARPEHIWPWLAQMGYQRGGLYSYDWLDRLFGYLDRASADRVLPQYQHLSPGDTIPIGHGPAIPVRAVGPGQVLVLGGTSDEFEWIWQFALHPLGGNRTRLVSRNSARVPPSFGWRLFMWGLKPAAFLMTRRMLLGIKQRAERLEAESSMAHAA